MNNNRHIALFFTMFVVLLLNCGVMRAQQDEDPEKKAEQLQKYIDKTVTDLERYLKLEEWQVFYVDSTLNHDYFALQAEFDALQSAKVNNSSMYDEVKDKWEECMDNSYKKIFTEEQWNTYLKQGGKKRIEMREKRKAKKDKATNATMNKKK